MNKYSMVCSCGEAVTIEAASREDAASNMKAMMTAEAIAKHMQEKHLGEPVPSVDQAHAMIEQRLAAA